MGANPSLDESVGGGSYLLTLQLMKVKLDVYLAECAWLQNLNCSVCFDVKPQTTRDGNGCGSVDGKGAIRPTLFSTLFQLLN